MSLPGALMAFHEAGISGPLRSHRREIRWLAERSELTLTLPEGGWASADFDGLGAQVVRGPYRALELPGSPIAAAGLAGRTRGEVRWFRAALRERRARVAIAVTTVVPALLVAARLEKVPSVVLAAEIWAGRGRLRELLGARLLGAEQRLSATIIACSDAVARSFPHPDGITTVHPAIDPADGRGDGRAFRLEHKIPADAPLIAAVGNITRGRGQRVLVQALPRLLRRRPELVCVINGAPFARAADLAFERELRELTDELGVTDSVIRTSGIEVGDLLTAADVVVNPATTYPEGFGRVALEAGFAGTPSVSTRVGAIPEIHEDGITTLLVPPGDVAALTAAVERLLDDDDLASEIAAGAASLARRIADPERCLQGFRDVVEPLLERP